MSKGYLENYLKEKQNTDQNLFVPYIMAGDGGLEHLPERISFLEKCGVGAVEVGIPFSDPIADGPTIQEAGIRALNNGTTLTEIFKTLQNTRNERKVPIIFMTYINPVLNHGIEQFALDCKNAGISGVILPDVSMEEEGIIAEPLKEQEIAYIRLAALTSSEDRLVELANRSEGFLYAVSVTGTTGARTNHADEVGDYLGYLKQHSSVPVLAGFGVSSAAQAHSLGSHCDGVIVGSKIVDLFHEGKTEEIRDLITASIQTEVKN